MESALSILGVGLAAMLTYVLGRRRDSEAHLREERVDAAIEFCEALMAYSGPQLQRKKDELAGVGESSALVEAARVSRARLWGAYYRVVLVVGDPEAARRCRVALRLAQDLGHNYENEDELEIVAESVRDAAEDFVGSVARTLGLPAGLLTDAASQRQ